MGFPNLGSRRAFPAAEPIALVYSEPHERIKIGMAYGQIGKRLLLIKATKSGMKNPTLYTGEGFRCTRERQHSGDALRRCAGYVVA